ncbi:small secreted protein [Diplodia corticola]|uniref:Small secreted protein n=1 Tax=Diplodia corticola TaxID=236234 RepID=A0A1J9QPY2_9PEZI|nr:small secreted protein [Diplodia corticola]OJD30982.1 small secreted protein [Diplodia corticola]
MFKLTTVLAVLAVTASATLDPATSNTKGKYPASPGCSPEKTSTAIQAAECAYNTRVSGTQTFAVFKTDHQYDSSNGAPYGTCEAYTCTAPTSDELTSGEDYWTFYWGSNGEDSGVGTTCIKSPDDGTCGCENSDGTFVYGSSDCT